ncbi:MAG: glycosyltransferase [Planctomycetota bacterium]
MSDERPTLGPQRVAVLTPSLTRLGGTEIYVQAALRALRAAGVGAWALTRDEPPADEPDARCVGELLDDTLSRRLLPARRRAVRALARDVAAGAELALVHGTAPGDLIEALGERLPVVLAVHTPILTCPAGSRFLPASGVPCTRAPGPGCLLVDAREGCLATLEGRRFSRLGRLRAALRGPLSLRLARRVTGMIFNSYALQRDFLRQVGAPRRSWVVRPPLVFAPGPPAGARDPDRLLAIGRLVPFKGVGDAIAALGELPPTVELEVLGDGPELGALRRRAEAAGLRERVHFRGWCDHEQVAAALGRAGCLLVPSRCPEAFGQIGPQALARGCPVVAYAVGGIPEWCSPEVGTLVPVGDVAGLARAVTAWRDRWAAGLDTARWPVQAQARWGEPRFAREYVAAVRAASQQAAGASAEAGSG